MIPPRQASRWCRSGARAPSESKACSACTPGSRSSPPACRSTRSTRSSAGACAGPTPRWWRATARRTAGSAPPASSTPKSAAPGVDELIKRIDKLAADYPYAKQYTLWPGPNSNTFVAYITRAIPELKADLPATAIGKDYLGGRVFSSAPSGSGFQFSLAGLLGMSASGVEGLELNILSLNFGVGPSGLKLPLLGRIGTPRIDTALALDAQASADFLNP